MKVWVLSVLTTSDYYGGDETREWEVQRVFDYLPSSDEAFNLFGHKLYRLEEFPVNGK